MNHHFHHSLLLEYALASDQRFLVSLELKAGVGILITIILVIIEGEDFCVMCAFAPLHFPYPQHKQVTLD